ncbi:MAG: hypothetical protein ACK5MI_07625 [Mangrovibacterium sp.]
MKNTLLFLILCLISLVSNAQKFEWDAEFRGIGDNREFSPQYARPQTIIGERASFALGTTIDSTHTLRVGLTHFYEFGTDINYNKPQVTAYYKFDNGSTQFFFGAFPRYDLLNFPLAMLTDTISYYHPNIGGTLAQHEWSWGNQLVFIDWTAKQLNNQREQFMAGTSGTIRLGNAYVENFLMMYHYALSSNHDDSQHIIDNTALNINLGYDFSNMVALDQFYIEVGLFTSQYRERRVSDRFESASSFLSTIFLQWKRLAVRNTLNIGGGHNILTGDSYYTANNYMRTDFILTLIEHKRIKATFNMSFHLADWQTIDNQQQMSVTYNIGS